MSKGTISKIERGEIQPSLAIAARLAEAFGVTLSEMLHQTPRARAVHIRSGQHVEAASHDGALRRRVLSPTFEHPEIEFIHFTIAPKRTSGVFPPHRYGSEEYLYVIRGEVLARIDSTTVHLRSGDSLYYEAQCEHELLNPGEDTAEGIAVVKR